MEINVTGQKWSWTFTYPGTPIVLSNEIIVPKGTFITGALFLKPGVNLFLAKEAVLKGSQNTNDYPWIDTRIAGLEMKWPAALINADGIAHLQIQGEGLIDGSGERWWKEYWDARAKEPNRVDPHFKIARPRLVHLINCTNVLVRGVTLKDSAFWNLQLTYCDGVEVRDVTVRAPVTPIRAASSDGIDIDSSRNVLITGCDIECADDAICLKSGRDADGLRVNRATENVEIVNCRVGNAAGMVVFGSETAGGIRKLSGLRYVSGSHGDAHYRARRLQEIPGSIESAQGERGCAKGISMAQEVGHGCTVPRIVARNRDGRRRGVPGKGAIHRTVGKEKMRICPSRLRHRHSRASFRGVRSISSSLACAAEAQ